MPSVQGAQVQTQIGELDPTCPKQEFTYITAKKEIHMLQLKRLHASTEDPICCNQKKKNPTCFNPKDPLRYNKDQIRPGAAK